MNKQIEFVRAGTDAGKAAWEERRQSARSEIYEKVIEPESYHSTTNSDSFDEIIHE